MVFPVAVGLVNCVKAIWKPFVMAANGEDTIGAGGRLVDFLAKALLVAIVAVKVANGMDTPGTFPTVGGCTGRCVVWSTETSGFI